MSAKGATVEFHSVTKRYGHAMALDRFSLRIDNGEFVTLLGPSGSGKTTALNILAGFTDATEGDVAIAGATVTRLPPEKRNLGMVFQNFSLFPHLTVFENVAFPLRLRRFPKPRLRQTVMQALEMVHLADYAERMPRTLSGGQQQRVAIARSVAFRPPVLLMDESLSALDLKLRESLQGELKRLHREIGCTILFVTHDQGEALTLSDRIAVMRDGAILQIDTPQAVYDRPGHRFVAEFIGNTNILAVERGRDGEAAIAGMQGRLGKLAEAFVSLRPEKLRRIAKGDDRAAFVLGEGRVSQALFRGESVHYTLQLESGTSLDFRETRAAGRTLLTIGDKITVGFRPQDVVPLADEQALETRTGKDETCVRK